MDLMSIFSLWLSLPAAFLLVLSGIAVCWWRKVHRRRVASDHAAEAPECQAVDCAVPDDSALRTDDVAESAPAGVEMADTVSEEQIADGGVGRDRHVASKLRSHSFLDEMDRFIVANIGNSSLSVNDIADHLNVSRSLLYLRLKQLNQGSVHTRINNVRFAEARRRLDEGLSVSETAYAVGMTDPNYFTKCFKRHFGITPSDYIRQRHGVS